MSNTLINHFETELKLQNRIAGLLQQLQAMTQTFQDDKSKDLLGRLEEMAVDLQEISVLRQHVLRDFAQDNALPATTSLRELAEALSPRDRQRLLDTRIELRRALERVREKQNSVAHLYRAKSDAQVDVIRHILGAITPGRYDTQGHVQPASNSMISAQA